MLASSARKLVKEISEPKYLNFDPHSQFRVCQGTRLVKHSNLANIVLHSFMQTVKTARKNLHPNTTSLNYIFLNLQYVTI